MDFICRICLNKNVLTWMNLSERFNTEFTIEELIKYCCGIELSTNISLPRFVCKSCFDLLGSAYKIKRKCLETEKMLLEQLETNIKKEKELEIVDILLDSEVVDVETPKEPQKIGSLYIRNDLILIQEECFTCEICLYKCRDKLDFRKHVVEHTMNKIPRPPQPPQMGQHSNSNQHQCNYCAQFFVSEILLENHKSNVHTR